MKLSDTPIYLGAVSRAEEIPPIGRNQVRMRIQDDQCLVEACDTDGKQFTVCSVMAARHEFLLHPSVLAATRKLAETLLNLATIDVAPGSTPP